MRALHKENHLIERIGWLRAAVLGANDGLISTSSLIVGVAEASAVQVVGADYRAAIAFLILIPVLLVKPSGLFGGRA